jgi:hypothetical protein
MGNAMTRFVPGLVIVGLCACANDEPPISPSDTAATRRSSLEGLQAATSGAFAPGPPARDAIAPLAPVPVPSSQDAGAGGAASSSDAGPAPCPFPDYPATDWSPDAWVPYPGGDAQELLDTVRATMPGDWAGLARTPWTTPYRVELSFTTEGRYSGRCSEVASECCRLFYYGSDEDNPLRQFRVDDVTLSGNVFGEIDVPFEYDDSYGLPSWQGELSQVQPDASGNGLRFLFRRSDGYGPIEYDLRRRPTTD